MTYYRHRLMAQNPFSLGLNVTTANLPPKPTPKTYLSSSSFLLLPAWACCSHPPTCGILSGVTSHFLIPLIYLPSIWNSHHVLTTTDLLGVVVLKLQLGSQRFCSTRFLLKGVFPLTGYAKNTTSGTLNFWELKDVLTHILQFLATAFSICFRHGWMKVEPLFCWNVWKIQ